MANKLFIPGPTEVRKEVLDSLSQPQVGHRTPEFSELFAASKEGLRELFLDKEIQAALSHWPLIDKIREELNKILSIKLGRGHVAEFLNKLETHPENKKDFDALRAKFIAQL